MKANIKKFVKERNEMLLKRDINELRQFINKCPLYSEEFKARINAASDEVLEITLHKMIVNVPKLPAFDRQASALWLITHGYDLNV